MTEIPAPADRRGVYQKNFEFFAPAALILLSIGIALPLSGYLPFAHRVTVGLLSSGSAAALFAAIYGVKLIRTKKQHAVDQPVGSSANVGETASPGPSAAADGGEPW
jgi:hypothetical protein